MTRRLPLILLLLLATTPALAQEWVGRSIISGTVDTADGGDPVEGAKVTLSLEGVETAPEPQITDAKGKWSLSGLRGGEWEIIIEKEGYIPYRDYIDLSATGERQRSSISLREIPAEEKAKKAQAQAAKIAQEGNALLEQQEYQGARTKWREALALSRDEDKGQLFLAIATTHSVEKNHDRAITVLEEGISAVGDDPELVKLMAAELAAVGRDEDAKQYIERLGEDAALNPSTYFNMGITAYNGNEMDKALGYFNEALSQNPDMVQGYYYRGLVHVNLSNNAEALADLQKFKDLAPADDPKIAEADTFLEYLQTLQ
ncbi:MAG: tetratricopeptide repeat protein [Acidobacteriota bacterium]